MAKHYQVLIGYDARCANNKKKWIQVMKNTVGKFFQSQE
jgi:hypothetical protein